MDNQIKWMKRRLKKEQEKLPGSILTEEDNLSVLAVTYKNKDFKFYINNDYPFCPPIRLYCNNKDMKRCSLMTDYCYACHSIICHSNWSPASNLTHIMEDYIIQLRESELKHLITLVMRRTSKDNNLPWIPNELIEHICTFIF